MATLHISQLQHYVFCPRQFALIELERQWEDNELTIEGQIFHEKVNIGICETRGKVKIVRTLPLAHQTLKLLGVADVVEYHTKGEKQIPYPIEYKVGKPKPHRADEVQLCAQAMCLEEMHQCSITEGAIFYKETRRHYIVKLDDALRNITLNAIQSCQEIIHQQITPKPRRDTHQCRRCSLKDKCHPKIFNKNAKQWLINHIQDNELGS